MQFGLHTVFKGGTLENPGCEWILTGLIGIAALLGALHGITLSGFAQIPGDLGDSRFNNFILEHSWRWILQKPGHTGLWHLPVFYPQPNTFAYSDLMLSYAPFYWIWRLAALQPDSAFLGWYLTVGFLNYYLAYTLLRKEFKLSFPASAAGASIISCAVIRIDHINHPQLFPLIYVLICLICVFRYFRYFSVDDSNSHARCRRLAVFIFFASIVLQFYGGFYNGYFMVLLACICCLFALALKSSRHTFLNAIKKDWVMLIIGAAFSAIILIPLARHYLDANHLLGNRSWEEVLTMLPRPQSLLYCGQRTYFYRWMNNISLWSNLPMRNEHSIGVGLMTSAVMVYAFYKNRTHTSIILIALTALSAILSTLLFWEKFTVWKIIYSVLPGASAIRAVARIGLLAIGIPAGIGVALFVNSFLKSKYLPLAVLIVICCFLEQIVADASYNYKNERKPVRHIVEKLDPAKKTFIVTINGKSPPPPYVVQIDAMMASLSSNIPTINGYSGSLPPGWRGFYDANTGDSHTRRQFLMDLSAWAKAYGLDLADIQWIELDAAYRKNLSAS